MPTPPPLTWTLSCQDFGPDAIVRYRRFAAPGRMFAFGGSQPVVTVRLIADEDGDLMGWWPAGDLRITRVEAARLFNTAFYEGFEVEEQRGRGCAIRLRAELIG